MSLVIEYNGHEFGDLKVTNDKIIIADKEFDLKQEKSLLWVFGFDKEYSPKNHAMIDVIGRMKYLKSVGYFLLDGSEDCKERLMTMFETADKFFARIGTSCFVEEPSYEIIDGEKFYYLETGYTHGYRIGENVFYINPNSDVEDEAFHTNAKLTKAIINDGEKTFAKVLTGDLGMWEDDERFHYTFSTIMDGWNVSFHPPKTALINTDILNPKQFTCVKLRDWILCRMEHGLCTAITYYPE